MLKQITKVIFCAVIIISAVLLFGCSKNSGFAGNSFVGSDSYCYNNKLYYVDNGKIKYLSYDTYSDNHLCFDPLCNHDTGECLAYIDNGFYMNIVVDEDESTEGVIIYASLSYLKDKISKTAIYRIDVKNNKKTVIADDLGVYSLNFPLINGNNLYFNAVDTNNIFRIYKMNKNGGKTEMLTPNLDNVYIYNIFNNVFYMFDDMGTLYSTEDFVNYNTVLSSKYAYGIYIYDNYLYYCDDEIYNSNQNNEIEAFDYQTGEFGSYVWPTRSYTYYRIPLNDINAEPEEVVSNALCSQRMLFNGNYLYMVTVGHRYLGGFYIYDPEYKLELPSHVAVTTDAIVKVNLVSLECEEYFMKDSDWEVYYIISADENYIVFYGENRVDTLAKEGNNGISYVIYDIKNNTYTKI